MASVSSLVPWLAERLTFPWFSGLLLVNPASGVERSGANPGGKGSATPRAKGPEQVTQPASCSHPDIFIQVKWGENNHRGALNGQKYYKRVRRKDGRERGSCLASFKVIVCVCIL